MQRTLLLIENDVNICELISKCMSEIGFDVVICSDGETGTQEAVSSHFDFIIIDTELPEKSGLETCYTLREKQINSPILMLAGDCQKADTANCLESGADDCIKKPFNITELKARVMARVRRMEGTYEYAREDEANLIKTGEMSIYLDKRKVIIRGEEKRLTAKEFDLLLFFASNPGRVFNRSQLLDHIWGYGFEGYEHTVNSHINRLRTKVEVDPSKPDYILTVWGVGYKFSEDIDS